MKRKNYGTEGVKLVKTSISLPEVLMQFAEKKCADEGFSSFSAYLSHLIRMEKERHQPQMVYPPHRPQAQFDPGTSAAAMNEAEPPEKPTRSGTAGHTERKKK